MLKVPVSSPPVPEASLGLVERDRNRGGEHGFGETGKLGGGLAAGGDGSEQRGELQRVRATGLIGFTATGQDEAQQGARLTAREHFALFHDALHIFMQSHEGKGIRRGQEFNIDQKLLSRN